MSSSDENEHNEIDCDTTTAQESSELFDESLRIASEEAISLKKDYILHLDNSRYKIFYHHFFVFSMKL